MFGYEEALGYAVGDLVRDKDGIGAALALLSLASRARASGQTLLGRWDALETAYGVHLRAQLTVPTRAPGQIMAGLRAAPPGELGGQPVLDVADLAGGGPLPRPTCSSSGWRAAGWWSGPAAPSRSSSVTWRSSRRPAPAAWPPPVTGPRPGWFRCGLSTQGAAGPETRAGLTRPPVGSSLAPVHLWSRVTTITALTRSAGRGGAGRVVASSGLWHTRGKTPRARPAPSRMATGQQRGGPDADCGVRLPGRRVPAALRQ